MVSIVKVSKDFSQKEVQRFLKRALIEDKEKTATVQKILENVKENGDKALYKYTSEFDKADLSEGGLLVGEKEMKEAYDSVNKSLIDALTIAKERIFAFHEEQKVIPCAVRERDLSLRQLALPIARAGIYVPGGRAVYPSSVLMNAIPAQVAGVEEIAMCAPPQANGKINPQILVAAQEVGLTEIYKLGGAQAIAALAYGTETVKKVDKIVGPGNIYVTLAKKLVTGTVGIDMLAGPSEVLIIADEHAKPAYIAADMLAQAEHDPQALAILVATSEHLAQAVDQELNKQVEEISRKETAKEAIKNHGAIFVVESIDVALELSNLIAPEHLELMFPGAEKSLEEVRNAGAIFIGSFTPEAIGDYVAGPNHVLPTHGTARFDSPLGVYDFIKFSSVIHFTREGFLRLAEAAKTIAEAEALDAHANSVKIRVDDNEDG